MTGNGEATRGQGEWVGLFRSVAAAQDDWLASMRRCNLGPRLTEEVAQARLPLVRPEDMAAWAPHLRELGESLCIALAEQEGTAALAKRLRPAMQTQRLAADRLASAALAGQADLLAAWSAEHDLDGQQLAFVAAALAGPPARLMAEGSLPSAGAGGAGGCPVCGHEPLLARIDAEHGRRWLICSLCGSQQRVPRVGCAFCGNSTQTSLGYLIPEVGPRGWRIDYCDTCGRYIKTVDERQAGPVGAEPLAVVDAATLQLDDLAQAHGYDMRARMAAN